MKRPDEAEVWADLKSPRELGLSTYEWSAAKQGMDEARMLGLISLEAAERFKSACREVGDSIADFLRLH